MRKLIKMINKKGFTLIELIVVILIIAIIAVSMAPNVIKWVDKARRSHDINTANTLALAVQIAFVAKPEAYETFSNWNKLAVNVSATVDGVKESYRVYLVAANEGPIYCFKGGEKTFGSKDGSTGFYGIINEEMGPSTTQKNVDIIPTYKAVRTGTGPKAGYEWQDTDRWRIVKRVDNGQFEIWTAQPHPYGGYPVYRLWPSPDDVYTK